MRLVVFSLSALLTALLVGSAQAFCGFYVAKADSGLFNQASQVVLVRDGNRTVITMANDFAGDVADFAVVVPVPTFIERGQINVGDPAVIEHLDAYTAPRLVEYFDPDPCVDFAVREQDAAARSIPAAAAEGRRRDALSKGVVIEASYTVGEYDILILSAGESRGLVTWLTDNGYRLPAGADAVIGSYLKQGMRFFVARVNIEAQRQAGFHYLRPLQVAFESDRFMLPIRLGTLNADGMQELFVYALTRSGRVETTNYRTVRLATDAELPEFVADEFADFYRDLFTRQVTEHDHRAVFLEYAWDMNWCDPCAADPLSGDELRSLGVFWLDAPRRRPAGRVAPSPAADVFVTRLHLRYDGRRFPEDLVLQETGDRSNFQGRYVIRRPYRAATTCNAAEYFAGVQKRQDREARRLASLTGWDIDDIRARIDFVDAAPSADEPWWRRLWN